MNVRTVFLALFLSMVVTVASAQTRKIRHRSHGGSPVTFAMVMDEDHLGEVRPRMDMTLYEVEPFVRKIRLHYEKVAAKNPDLTAEAPAANGIPSGIQASDSALPTLQQSAPAYQDGGKRPKKSSKLPSPEAMEIPSPDFLLQTQMREAAQTTVAISAPVPQNNPWLLWGLLAIPIAPGIFLASAIVGHRRGAALPVQNGAIHNL